jgi:3-oxoacyl-[acyl-carrier-protein] synthase-3
MPYAEITGWGHSVPERVVTNDELASIVDTSDEWIQSRTGIHERRYAAPDETTSSLCAIAAVRALERAHLDASDLQLVICATTTPNHLSPATACLIQKEIGAASAGAFDLSAGCSGFLSALVVGTQSIKAGTFERILVVSGETLSRRLNSHDRATCVLFDDGAGAVVLEASGSESGVVTSVLCCDGDTEELLTVGSSVDPHGAALDVLAPQSHYVRMRGNELFKLAVRRMQEAALLALDRAQMPLSKVRMVIPHQANARIISALRQALCIPVDRVFLNLDRYGNVGSAWTAIALWEFLSSTSPEPGSPILVTTFGGGLTWVPAVIAWSNVKS